VGGGAVSYWRRGDQQPETIRGAELTCGTSPGLEHGGVVAMGGGCHWRAVEEEVQEWWRWPTEGK
jgi:hypothetical protein